jgi:hypothetical protein
MKDQIVSNKNNLLTLAFDTLCPSATINCGNFKWFAFVFQYPKDLRNLDMSLLPEISDQYLEAIFDGLSYKMVLCASESLPCITLNNSFVLAVLFRSSEIGACIFTERGLRTLSNTIMTTYS